jgi:uncharacterized protein (TIGR02118 family)
MYKLTFCLRRAPGMSREEFQRYWLEVHGPLVLERAEAIGVRRYVQVHTVDLPELHEALRARNGGAPEPYDGVAELWFDVIDFPGDEAAQQAGAELLADERNFIDLPNSPIFVAEEHVIIG